jgi:hypothetical protein
MSQSPQKVFGDIFEIFLDFLKAPLAYMRSNFHRETGTLFVYAGIVFIAIGFLGLGLSLLDGLADIFGLVKAVLQGSLTAYAHMFVICFFIYLFFRYRLKETRPNSEWLSMFFLASIPYWVVCIVMNFVTRAVIAFELIRLAGLLYVLWHRFATQRKNYMAWLAVVLIFILVNYPKFKDTYALFTFDLNALPTP